MKKTIVRFPDTGHTQEFYVEAIAIENGVFVLVTGGEPIGFFPALGQGAVSIYHPDGPNKVQLVEGVLKAS